jgi:hypothetical protein
MFGVFHGHCVVVHLLAAYFGRILEKSLQAHVVPQLKLTLIFDTFAILRSVTKCMCVHAFALYLTVQGMVPSLQQEPFYRVLYLPYCLPFNTWHALHVQLRCY